MKIRLQMLDNHPHFRVFGEDTDSFRGMPRNVKILYFKPFPSKRNPKALESYYLYVNKLTADNRLKIKGN